MSDDVAVRSGRQVSWIPPIAWLPWPLLEPRNPLRSIALGWILAFPASILLAAALQLLAPDAQPPEFGKMSVPAAIGLLVLFAPILETLIMGGALLVLLRVLRPTWAVIASAIGWGVAHSLAVPIWGLVIWWPFLIFSILFVVWRERSLWLAFAMPIAVHGLQNLVPALLLAYDSA